jgi:hypothetical protein
VSPALFAGMMTAEWLACRVLFKIVYLLTCRVLSLAVPVFRSDRAKDAELLVLRHENAVLRWHVGRVRYGPGDRLWFAAVARLLPRRYWDGIFSVTPATLLGDIAGSMASWRSSASRLRRPPCGRSCVFCRHRSGTSPVRPDVAPVPAGPGRRDPRG